MAQVGEQRNAHVHLACLFFFALNKWATQHKTSPFLAKVGPSVFHYKYSNSLNLFSGYL